MAENSSFSLGYLVCVIFIFCIYIAANSYPVYLSMGSSFYLLAVFSFLLNCAFIPSLIAVVLLPRFRRTCGFILLIFGLLLLPFSALMLYGLARRNSQLRFASLKRWDGVVNDPPGKYYLSIPMKKIFNVAAILFTYGMVSLFYPSRIIGCFIAPIGLIYLVNIFRARDKYQIALYGENLLLTPSFFADTYIVPLTECRLRLIFRDTLEITVNHISVVIRKAKEQDADYFLATVNAICQKSGIAGWRDILVSDIPD